MRKILIPLALLFLVNTLFCQQAKTEYKKEKVLYPYIQYVPIDYNKDTLKYPVLIYLHGASHCGSNLNMLKVWAIPEMIDKGEEFPFIIAAPQCPGGKYWGSDNWFEPLLKDLKSKFRVDDKRIYLTGVSMGGFATWQTAIDYPDIIAAIVPLCGGADTSKVCTIKDIPVWAFHGTADKMVPIANSENAVNKLKSCGGNVLFTKIEGGNHNITGVYKEHKEIYDWLLKQSKK